MIVDSICDNLQRKIQHKNFTGVVHSVFHSAFNVITSDNEFIIFLNCSKPMSPNSIRISDNISFFIFGIEPGMRLYFNHNYIRVEDLGIDIIIEMASKWNVNPTFTYLKDSSNNVFLKLEIMKDFLENSHKLEGILPLLTVLNEKYNGFELISIRGQITDKNIIFMKDRFLRFIEAYIEEDFIISDRVSKIIGFGVGLTPSMDDFISGLMISRIYLYDYLNKNLDACFKFNELIVKNIDGKTTRVSEEMLKYSSKGEVNEDIRNMMLSLISKSKDNDFILNIKKVASFGETSGTDIISGIYIGSKIIFNQFSRR